MDNCKVNFVHKQQYKVYNHFENLEKQIGYVELNKLYYIAQNYHMPVNLLEAMLNQNIDTIDLCLNKLHTNIESKKLFQE